MPAKSTLEQLDIAIRDEVNNLILGGATIDAITAHLQEFNISRSAVGRYSHSKRDVIEKMHQSRKEREAFAEEMGEYASLARDAKYILENLQTQLFEKSLESPNNTEELDMLSKTAKRLSDSLKNLQEIDKRAKEQANQENQEKLKKAKDTGKMKQEAYIQAMSILGFADVS